MTNPSIRVVGSGVIGLTTAVTLAQRGLKNVRITTASEERQLTTSHVAAAFWYPYHIAAADEWGRRTYERFGTLLDEHPPEESGVRRIVLEEYFQKKATRAEVTAKAWWKDLAGVDFQLIDSGHPIPGSRKTKITCGIRFNTFVLQMDLYMRLLESWARELEIPVEYGKRLKSPAAAFADGDDVVVNCTGAGAREFLINGELQEFRSQAGIPLRGEKGQVVIVPKASEFDTLVFIKEDDFVAEPFYIVPRVTDMLLGGSITVLERPSIDHAVNLPEPSSTVTARILERCEELFPKLPLGEPDQRTPRLGIRPTRTPVMLSVDRAYSGSQGKYLMHNYGHGGAGVTYSWGCAEEIASLLSDLDFGK